MQRQDEAGLWSLIAHYSFWLRHRSELGATFPRVSRELIPALEGFFRYGFELEVLEHDLAECINEFRQACESLYADTEHLELKKSSAVYHVDNLHVRVHKFLEDVRALLGLLAGLDPETYRPRDGRPFKRAVDNALLSRGLQDVGHLLRSPETDRRVKAAVDARHRFVHHYRDEPAWPMLHPMHRYRPSGDALGAAVRTLEGANLDRYVAKKFHDLGEIVTTARLFRRSALSDPGTPCDSQGPSTSPPPTPERCRSPRLDRIDAEAGRVSGICGPGDQVSPATLRGDRDLRDSRSATETRSWLRLWGLRPDHSAGGYEGISDRVDDAPNRSQSAGVGRKVERRTRRPLRSRRSSNPRTRSPISSRRLITVPSLLAVGQNGVAAKRSRWR
jgi:hypothetical protein